MAEHADLYSGRASEQKMINSAALDALLAENEQLRTALDKGRAFVATTSYYRQRKESRPEFEAFAFALLGIRNIVREALAEEADRG